jgi:hypothetical protein
LCNGGTGDYFERGNLGKLCENIVVNAVDEERIFCGITAVGEW